MPERGTTVPTPALKHTWFLIHAESTAVTRARDLDQLITLVCVVSHMGLTNESKDKYLRITQPRTREMRMCGWQEAQLPAQGCASWDLSEREWFGTRFSLAPIRTPHGSLVG